MKNPALTPPGVAGKISLHNNIMLMNSQKVEFPLTCHSREDGNPEFHTPFTISRYSSFLRHPQMGSRVMFVFHAFLALGVYLLVFLPFLFFHFAVRAV